MLQILGPLSPPLKKPPQYWHLPFWRHIGRLVRRYSASLAWISFIRRKSSRSGSSGHPSKAVLSISRRLWGSSIVRRDTQFLNAPARISSRSGGSCTSRRDAQEAKAFSRITRSDVGSTTRSTPVPWKASGPIVRIPSGTWTSSASPTYFRRSSPVIIRPGSPAFSCCDTGSAASGAPAGAGAPALSAAAPAAAGTAVCTASAVKRTAVPYTAMLHVSGLPAQFRFCLSPMTASASIAAAFSRSLAIPLSKALSQMSLRRWKLMLFTGPITS